MVNINWIKSKFNFYGFRNLEYILWFKSHHDTCSIQINGLKTFIQDKMSLQKLKIIRQWVNLLIKCYQIWHVCVLIMILRDLMNMSLTDWLHMETKEKKVKLHWNSKKTVFEIDFDFSVFPKFKYL